ncbi:MAG: hybrid sensor histidine kinase/response regulator [Kiritimatiellia bacterium]
MNNSRNNKSSPPLILIVDDNPNNLNVLGNILQREACDIAVATDGQQALAFAGEEHPDLILLDVMMPGLDGFEVCRRLKAAPGTAGIPVIFLTARTEAEDIVNGFKAGAVDYVTKPFNSAELLARVRTQLELLSSRRSLEETGRTRKELLHVLCHDLANPLNAVRGLLELSDDAQSLAEARAPMLEAAMNGLAIIDMVRAMQAMEDRRLSLEGVNLAGALRQSASIIKLPLERKNLSLELRVGEELAVMAEKVSLVNSVLNNLLTNAIKFSHPGGKIEVSAAAEGGKVVLRIRDRGIGMPSAFLRDIFDFHKTTSRPGTAGESGTGFGMPLVKRFMEAYGGAIAIASSEAASAPADHGTEVALSFRPPAPPDID